LFWASKPKQAAKMTRQPMPSAAPAVLLRSPPRFTTLGDVAAQMTRRDVGMLCNFTLRLRHGREIAQPYRFWGLLGFPPRSERNSTASLLFLYTKQARKKNTFL